MIENIKSFLAVTEADLAEPVILKLKNNVFYLLLNTKVNSFTKEFMRSIHSKLDVVEEHPGPTALVAVSLSKTFSGGLNLTFLKSAHDEDRRYFLEQFSQFLGRISGLSVPTICVVRGPAIAEGCIFAFAFDQVYVAGKALFWANEAAIHMCPPSGAIGTIKKRHACPNTLRDMLLVSEKFDEKRCLQSGIIDGIWGEGQAVGRMQQRALQLAEFGSNKQNVKKIKCQMHKQIVQDCFGKISPFSVVGYDIFGNLPKL